MDGLIIALDGGSVAEAASSFSKTVAKKFKVIKAAFDAAEYAAKYYSVWVEAQTPDCPDYC